MRIAPLLILAAFVACPAAAGPWIAPGDSGLRSDIQLLADAGVITSPVTTWPLSWGDIAASLDASPADLTIDEGLALNRVRRRLAEAMDYDVILLRAHASAAETPRFIRTFEDGPREDAEIGIGAEWTGDWFAFDLEAQWVDDPADGKEWRGDGSYVGVALGNWMLAGSITDRYWGPGWFSSLIMSNNARPIPAVTLERNSTEAFETKWLSWIGPWDFSVMFGWLESDRAVPDSRLFAARLNFRPLKSLEIGISRSALWCGDGQACDFGAFVDVLFRGDDEGGSSNPDQLGGFDARWSSAVFGIPFALYFQLIGEDENNFLPTDYLGQFGGETWGYWDALGSYRLYLEWSDTECDFRFYRSIRGDSGPGSPGCAYTNGTYQSGQHYRGRSFAHSTDGDSSVFILGGVLTDKSDHQWLGNFAIGNLDRRNSGNNFIAPNKARYREFELVHKRDFWIGDLDIGAGYVYLKDTVTGDADDDFRGFVEWSVTY